MINFIGYLQIFLSENVEISIFNLSSGVSLKIFMIGGFPGGAVVKNPPANAGDMGLSPGPGRSHMPRSN